MSKMFCPRQFRIIPRSSKQNLSNNADAYQDRGFLYERQNNLLQAIADFSKVIEINPKFVNIYNRRGIDYKNQGNLSQAIADYTKVIELDPGNSSAYWNRALAYDAKGNVLKQSLIIPRILN